MKANEIGVFSRCMGFQDIERTFEAVKEMDLRVVQVQSLQLPEDYYSKEGTQKFVNLLKKYGLEVSALCLVFKGEQYSDWETVKRTVGYLPQDRVAERIKYSKRCIDFAMETGISIVTTHMGVLPEDHSTVSYHRLLSAVREVARYCQDRGVTLALETGQETSAELREFIQQTGEDVRVNFDGANFIIYGLDEPIEALDTLKDLIVHVHIKDGLLPARRGLLGEEVPLGEGRAEVAKTMHKLVECGYAGPFIMEVYFGMKRGADPLSELRKSKAFLERCLKSSKSHQTK